MNRIIMWVMGTVTVMVLLFGYHTSTGGGVLAQTSQLAPNQPAISGGAATTSSASTSNKDTSGASAKSSSGSAKTSKTIAGDNVSTRWGPVQVQITVTKGKLTAVDMLAYPYDNPTDQQISSYSLPILISETIDAQSAQIDMVSGATYTSDGYLQSLQSALDQAGL